MAVMGYKLRHDTGFAPNPFHGFLTLATCKPAIRRCRAKGDWVAGFASKETGSTVPPQRRARPAGWAHLLGAGVGGPDSVGGLLRAGALPLQAPLRIERTGPRRRQHLHASWRRACPAAQLPPRRWRCSKGYPRQERPGLPQVLLLRPEYVLATGRLGRLPGQAAGAHLLLPGRFCRQAAA